MTYVRNTTGFLALTSLLVLAYLSVNVRRSPNPTVLYTAPHAEVAPFQRVWNPDTNNDYTVDDFAKDSDSDEDGVVTDDLCGPDGTNCPELPAFGGEDYFSNTPVG